MLVRLDPAGMRAVIQAKCGEAVACDDVLLAAAAAHPSNKSLALVGDAVLRLQWITSGILPRFGTAVVRNMTDSLKSVTSNEFLSSKLRDSPLCAFLLTPAGVEPSAYMVATYAGAYPPTFLALL